MPAGSTGVQLPSREGCTLSTDIVYSENESRSKARFWLLGPGTFWLVELFAGVLRSVAT